jgi:tetratricopeptide (TPR) repeat protein
MTFMNCSGFLRWRPAAQALYAIVQSLVLLGVVMPVPIRSQSSTAQQKNDTAVKGTVRDSGGKPVSEAFVFLEEKGGARLVRTKTNADGSFIFLLQRAGTYSIRAEKSGVGSAATDGVHLELGESQRCDFVLVPTATRGVAPGAGRSVGPASAMELADEPNFTVAGVTDWSNAGLHGSDARARTSDTLTKETLALGAGASTEKGDNFSSNTSYNLALEYLAKGDFVRAREEARKSLAFADTAQGHHLLGDLDERLNDPLEAVHEFERAAHMDPSEQNYFDWGAELLIHKAPQPAAEVFAKGSNVYPDSARLLSGWGAALYAAGAYEEAARRLCAASDLRPAEAAPYLLLGEMQRATPASSPCSEERLARFVQVKPENAMANYYYGVALWKRERASGVASGSPPAEAFLEKAVKIDPQLAEAYVELGMMRAARGDLGSAIRTYQQAITLNPKLSDAHYQLSLAYKRSGETKNAHQEYEVYQQLEREDAAARERNRRNLRQFVVTLKDQAPASAEPQPPPH